MGVSRELFFVLLLLFILMTWNFTQRFPYSELICPVGSSASSNTVTNTTVTNTSNSINTEPINFHLSIQSVESEAQLSVGYSPFLNFNVDDMDMIVARCVQMGANLDGPIQYPAMGKVAALRTPDGNMIGLYEPTTM